MKSITTRLDLNNKQRTECLKHSGTGRHAWNWALAYCIEKIRAGEWTPSAVSLHKILNREVKTENPWYYESSKCAPQQALRNLEKAFTKFWKEHKKMAAMPINKRYKAKFIRMYNKGELQKLSVEHEKGFPKFKKKNVQDSFYLEGPAIQITNHNIKVPFIGWLKTYETLPQNAKPKSVSIGMSANKWYISFISENNNIIPEPNGLDKPVGVDLGISKLAVLSDGLWFETPQDYKKQIKKIKRLQRKLSRQKLAQEKAGRKENSNNYNKTKLKLAKVHERVADIRKDNTHKLTSYLAKNHSKVIIEGLNVSGMLQNHNLASAIANGGFYEFKRQLEYKCLWNGTELVIADQWFASSQYCSCCHHKQKMPLKERTFVCENCKIEIDRDLNAAINLLHYEEMQKEVDDAKAKKEEEEKLRIKEEKKQAKLFLKKSSKKNKRTKNIAPSFGVKVCGDTKVQVAVEKPELVSVEIKKKQKRNNKFVPPEMRVYKFR